MQRLSDYFTDRPMQFEIGYTIQFPERSRKVKKLDPRFLRVARERENYNWQGVREYFGRRR